jgi:hypothetical protein
MNYKQARDGDLMIKHKRKEENFENMHQGKIMKFIKFNAEKVIQRGGSKTSHAIITSHHHAGARQVWDTLPCYIKVLWKRQLIASHDLRKLRDGHLRRISREKNLQRVQTGLGCLVEAKRVYKICDA